MPPQVGGSEVRIRDVLGIGCRRAIAVAGA